MTTELDTFDPSSWHSEEKVEWANGSMPLRVRVYLGNHLPSAELISTVRALVFQENRVLVVRDRQGSVHLTPGGRREAGETLDATLRREVLEETGWTLEQVVLLGFLHFHHLAPKPEGYRYPYPDFVQLVFWAEAGEYRQEAREIDGNEIEAQFLPLEDLDSLPLSLNQRVLLQASLQQRGEK